MPQKIGTSLPPPLSFELGNVADRDVANAALLVTVDDDGCPRVAVIAAGEASAPGPSVLRLRLHAQSQTAVNVRAGRCCVLWCVLDAAAYSICASSAVSAPDEAAYDLKIQAVWRDFVPDAPLVSGPTYKRL